MNKTKLINCEYFGWRLFRRDGVFYADGRSNSPNLGKHSLTTRDREEVQQRLRQLDRKKAVEQGLMTDTVVSGSEVSISIGDAWEQFLEHCGRPAVVGGAKPKGFAERISISKRASFPCRTSAAAAAAAAER